MCRCLHLCVGGCVHVHADVLGVQNKTLESLRQEVQVVVGCSAWVLGTELQFSGKAASDLNC